MKRYKFCNNNIQIEMHELHYTKQLHTFLWAMRIGCINEWDEKRTRGYLAQINTFLIMFVCLLRNQNKSTADYAGVNTGRQHNQPLIVRCKIYVLFFSIEVILDYLLSFLSFFGAHISNACNLRSDFIFKYFFCEPFLPLSVFLSTKFGNLQNAIILRWNFPLAHSLRSFLPRGTWDKYVGMWFKSILINIHRSNCSRAYILFVKYVYLLSDVFIFCGWEYCRKTVWITINGKVS